MIRNFTLAAAVLGIPLLFAAPRVEAQDNSEKQVAEYVDRDGDGICDKFQNNGADSQNRHRHRLRHRDRGQSKMRGFGHGHGQQ